MTDDDLIGRNDSDDGRTGSLVPAVAFAQQGNLNPLYVELSTVVPQPGETTPGRRDRSRRDIETAGETGETRSPAPCLAVSTLVSANVSGGQWEGFSRPVIAGPDGCYGSRGVKAAQWLEQFRPSRFLNRA